MKEGLHKAREIAEEHLARAKYDRDRAKAAGRGIEAAAGAMQVSWTKAIIADIDKAILKGK